MKYRIPPKVAMINSFAGYGRCSTTEVVPILSAMKVQVCPVPTAVYSNHTGFPSYYCHDFTGQLPGYLEQWERLGLSFDGIYVGLLGQKEQIPVVADFIRHQRLRGCPLVLIDPIMGDHGNTYRPVSPEYCEGLKELVRLADIITPNITEACLLTGARYKDNGWRQEELADICEKLHAFGPDKVAITGLRRRSPQGYYDSFINFVSQRRPGSGSLETTSTVTRTAGPSRHGTGDIFAAIVAGDAVRGGDFVASVEKAASFISLCIHASDELGIPEYDGICSENFLGALIPPDEPNAPQRADAT